MVIVKILIIFTNCLTAHHQHFVKALKYLIQVTLALPRCSCRNAAFSGFWIGISKILLSVHWLQQRSHTQVGQSPEQALFPLTNEHNTAMLLVCWDISLMRILIEILDVIISYELTHMTLLVLVSDMCSIFWSNLYRM